MDTSITAGYYSTEGAVQEFLSKPNATRDKAANKQSQSCKMTTLYQQEVKKWSALALNLMKNVKMIIMIMHCVSTRWQYLLRYCVFNHM